MSRLDVARLGAIALFATGCVRTHLQHDAPGNIDVRKPPEHPENRKPERPDDPGEHLLVTSIGPYGGAGITSGGDRDGKFSASLGAEASVIYGRSARSHFEDDFYVLPASGVGVNLGANLISSARTGPSFVYSELQIHSEVYGIAAGWAYDPRLGASGPQATAFFGPFYLRSTTLLSQSTDVQLGLFFKLPAVWIWSR